MYFSLSKLVFTAINGVFGIVSYIQIKRLQGVTVYEYQPIMQQPQNTPNPGYPPQPQQPYPPSMNYHPDPYDGSGKGYQKY